MGKPKSEIYIHATKSVEFLRESLPKALHRPSVGIICGSGLGGLVDSIRKDRSQVEIPYKEIPYFPISTVQGHAGKLLFGFLGEKEQPVVLMVGRAHFYEGHSIHNTTFPVRVLKMLGVAVLIITNAAGGLNHAFKVGDIVILGDHLNLAGMTGVHPLQGPNIDELGTRFPPLSDAYDLDLRRQAYKKWTDIRKQLTNDSRALHEGIYAYVGGPSYETRAECRMLRMLGADLVGMSTVPEIIVARHCEIRVLAISLVTNLAVFEAGPKGDDPRIAASDAEALTNSQSQGKANHEDVLQAGIEAAKDLQLLVCALVNDLDTRLRS